MLRLVAVVMVTIPSCAIPAIDADDIIGAASVIDGDTIEIYGTHIRLHGIDPPASRQECRRPDGSVWRCGQQAVLALSDRIGHTTIRCELRGRDHYQRVIDGETINIHGIHRR